MSLSVTIKDNTAPVLRRLATAGDGVRMAMGRSVARALTDYFTRLESGRPNRLGGKRTHFWSEVGKAVQQPAPEGAGMIRVSINHVGIAQRLFGGTLRPREKKWLAVPARAEAHGRSPGEFNDLKFVRFRADLAALVQTQQTIFAPGKRDKSITPTGGRKGGVLGGGVFWWLKKSVTQKPDPTVLPPRHALVQAAVESGEKHLQTLLRRAGGDAA